MNDSIKNKIDLDYFTKKITNKPSFFLVNYILINVGLIMSFLIKTNFSYRIILPMAMIPGICLILNYIYNNIIKGKYKKENVTFKRIYSLVGIAAFILIPILIGISFNSNAGNQIDITKIVSLTVIILPYCIAYNHILKNGFLNEPYEDVLTVIIIIMGLMLYISREHLFTLMNSSVNLVINYMDQFLSVNLTVILLCATVALLSFTHAMVLDDEEIAQSKKNGERLFTATIFSIIIFLILLLLTFMKPYMDLIDNANMLNMILISIYSLLSINTILFVAITIYYVIVSTIETLKQLNPKL